MILQSLYELAKREGLSENPDFEKKRVDVFLRIDADGNLLEPESSGEKVGRGLEVDVPRFPNRTIAVSAALLCDKAEYVLGFSNKENKPGRLALCTAAFDQRVNEAAAATADAGVLAVQRFLKKRDQFRPELIASYPFGDQGWTGSEIIAFRFEDELALSKRTTIVHQRPAVREYWSKLRSPVVNVDAGGIADSKGAALFTCLVTGRPAIPHRLHDKIKRIPGSLSQGAALVSFNNDAFTSHGLEQGSNAPVCREAAEGYVTALNWLLGASTAPVRRFRSGVQLGDDAVAVFWTRDANAVVEEVLDCFAPPDVEPDTEPARSEEGRRATENFVRAISEAPYKGEDSATADDTPFYAVTLSANARVIVRDYFVTKAADVRRNLSRYFQDLQLGSSQRTKIPLREIKAALTAPGREPSTKLEALLFRAALCGGPLPRTLLWCALSRLRLPPDPKTERRLLHLRCALIKATLIRLKQEVSVSLDESNVKPAYLLGRLFAVLEQLQQAALGDINASIRDRFFGAASTTPQAVFPRLVKLSMHHLKKSERYDLEKIKSRIVGSLPPEPFPRLLLLEDQGLFAIGYYHQRESQFTKKAAAATE